MPSSSKNRPKNRPGTARTPANLKSHKMPHFCLKVREIAKNGTKAHPPKNRVFSRKTTPKIPALHARNQSRSKNLHTATPSNITNSPPNRLKNHQKGKIPRRSAPFPTICARFGLILQEWAENCSKLHEVAKICTKLKENAQTCKKRRALSSITRPADRQTHSYPSMLSSRRAPQKFPLPACTHFRRVHPSAPHRTSH